MLIDPVLRSARSSSVSSTMPPPDGAPSAVRVSNQQQHIAKIDAVLTAISDNKWSSINEFLLAFYTCQDPKISSRARRSIAYTKKKSISAPSDSQCLVCMPQPPRLDET